MPDAPRPPGVEAPEERLRAEVARRAERHRRAQRERGRGVWHALGLMGMVGWSVAVPTLVGAALGAWIDRRWPGGVSWTLTLLLAGAALGCLNAWRWVTHESGGGD